MPDTSTPQGTNPFRTDEQEPRCPSCEATIHPEHYRGHNPWCRKPRDPREKNHE